VGDPAGDGALVFLHDLMHSHRGLAPAEGVRSPDGWARALVQECRDLPALSVEDMARAAAAALRGLVVRRARALIGVGLGGQVALEVGSRFGELCAGVIALGAPRVLPQGLREQLALAPQLLASDPEGTGLRPLRKVRLELLRRHHGRERLASGFEDAFRAERWLEEEAAALARHVPGPAFASLAQAFGACDLSDRLPEMRPQVLLVCCATDEVAPPARVRDAYHALTAGGARTHLYELQSDGGHECLTQEAQKLRGPVQAFLAGLF
jgi:homoserine O-acetyltransferase